MPKSISHLSAEATQLTNQTGVQDPILEVDPENGTLLKFHDEVPMGDARGLAVIGKFRDANGNPLPTDTTLVATVDRPTDDVPTAVSVQEDNIAPWNGLTTQEQRNEENIDAVKINLKGDTINVRDKDTLRFELESSTAIDWNNSEFYIVREGVDEEPFEG